MSVVFLCCHDGVSSVFVICCLIVLIIFISGVLSHVSGVTVFTTVSVLSVCFSDGVSVIFRLQWCCCAFIMMVSVVFLYHVSGVIVFSVSVSGAFVMVSVDFFRFQCCYCVFMIS